MDELTYPQPGRGPDLLPVGRRVLVLGGRGKPAAAADIRRAVRLSGAVAAGAVLASALLTVVVGRRER